MQVTTYNTIKKNRAYTILNINIFLVGERRASPFLFDIIYCPLWERNLIRPKMRNAHFIDHVAVGTLPATPEKRINTNLHYGTDVAGYVPIENFEYQPPKFM